ncbi:hypothetical protein EJ110_NYTH50381 [Nymphaea thermarum]|nr:hypothetical protein EJ110_NYTH50381 [Nymphaea thermarum]
MQLKEAKKKLNESQSKPIRLRRKRDTGESKVIADGAASITKLEDGLTNLKHTDEVQTHIQNGSTPQLLIPALSSKTRPPKRLSEGSMKLAVGSQDGTLVLIKVLQQLAFPSPLDQELRQGPGCYLGKLWLGENHMTS